MITIEFKSSRGSFKMGGALFDGIRLYEVKGLDYLAPTRSTKIYNNTYGTRTTSRHLGERTITLNGELNKDVVNRTHIKEDIQRAIQDVGILSITGANGKYRQIKAEATGCEFGDRNPLIQKFTLQFVCEEPLFYGRAVETLIGTEEKLIKGTFALPMPFSRLTDVLYINNRGDYPIEPVIDIYDMGTRTYEGATDSIKISNYTTDKEIELTLTTLPDEVITVDVPNRTVTSNKREGLLWDYVGNLTDIMLGIGGNDISVINGTNRLIGCRIKYKALYGACVI